VIYSTVRPYLLNIAIVDQDFDPEPIASTAFGILHPFEGVNNRYLFYWLRSAPFTAYVQAGMKGMAYPAINDEKFYSGYIALPPLAEQKRIVAKVDELMALCDRLEAQQQERETRHAALARASLARFADAPTPANLPFLFHPSYAIPPADLRKSILTLAVQGKLVPQDPNDEDARAMIVRAMEKRQQTIKSKSLRRKELDESADLFEHADLPSSWCVERFANLVDPENTISYGVLVPGNDVPDGIPFVRAQDLCLSNHPARPNKTIAPEIEKPYARTRLAGGEILLCVVGSIGKLGVVPDSWAGANIARAVARIKPIPDVLRDYLLLVLQEQSVQNYFTSTTRTLAQPTLNVGMIEQTPIPIPPLAEQRRIVAKVGQLMALVDALETQLAASRATAANLLSALVAELTVSEGAYSHRPVRPPPARPGLPGVVK
jgi:type I restriction enzyme S subunit